MAYTQIRSETVGAIHFVRLDRPDKLNAFTATMGDELLDAFRRARDDAAVRVFVQGQSRCQQNCHEHARDMPPVSARIREDA